MAKPGKSVPEGFHAITPHITVRGAAKAIDFYKQAFGGKNEMICYGPDGTSVMHAELEIGGSKLMLGEENPEWQCFSPLSKPGDGYVIHLYVDDVDKVHAQAVKAGAKVTMPVTDMFWGDRYGQVMDPFGHKWSIATHKEDLSPEEIKQRAEAFFANMGAGACGQS